MLLTIKRFLEMFTPRQQLLPRSTIVYRNFTGLSSKIVWFFFFQGTERERVGFPQQRVLSILFNKDGWTKLGKVDENYEGVSHSNCMVAKVLSHPFELMLFKNYQLLYLFFNFLFLFLFFFNIARFLNFAFFLCVLFCYG